MKLPVALMTAFCLCCVAHGIAEKNQVPEPKWKVDLLQRYEFQAFDRTISSLWSLNQDVLFLSSDRILVYQVNRSRAPVSLAGRDASGGAGNFLLNIRVLDARDGRDIKSLQLPTNADSSSILATREGRFIVRTGEVLYLYSADFERIASRTLPLKRQVQEEAWQVDVSPSGKEVMLVHQQILKRDAMSPTSDVTRAQTDLEVLNASTLQVIKSITLPSSLLVWHAADHVLLSGKPIPAQGPFGYGLLDFEGKWSPLSALDGFQEKQSCGYKVEPLDRQRFAAFGCGRLSVFSLTGETLFSINIGSKEFVGSVEGAGDYLAIQYERHSTQKRTSAYVPVLVAQPLRLDVYDMTVSNPRLSLPLHSSRVYYAVSPGGSMAVVEGTALELFEPQH